MLPFITNRKLILISLVRNSRFVLCLLHLWISIHKCNRLIIDSVIAYNTAEPAVINCISRFSHKHDKTFNVEVQLKYLRLNDIIHKLNCGDCTVIRLSKLTTRDVTTVLIYLFILMLTMSLHSILFKILIELSRKSFQFGKLKFYKLIHQTRSLKLVSFGNIEFLHIFFIFYKHKLLLFYTLSRDNVKKYLHFKL